MKESNRHIKDGIMLAKIDKAIAQNEIGMKGLIKPKSKVVFQRVQDAYGLTTNPHRGE